MPRSGRWLAVAALLAATSATAEAQVALEVRGGGAIGNHAPAAAGLETLPGPSLSTTALFRPVSWLSLYGTFARASFGCEEGFCTGRDVRVTSMGYGGGLRLHAGDLLWVQGGVTRLDTDVAADGADDAGEPENALEAGAGLSIPIVGPVRLVPGVTLRRSVDPGRRTTLLSGELGMQMTIGRNP